MNRFLYVAILILVFCASCTDTKKEKLSNLINEWFAGGNLAASNIRNLECPSYEVYLIDYGCGKFNKKVHIME